MEGNLVREILYGNKDNVNFVHEVYRQAFLLSFSHSPAIKKVISVYKDWIQVCVVTSQYCITKDAVLKLLKILKAIILFVDECT